MSFREAITGSSLSRTPVPQHHFTRRRAAALLFFLIAGYGLAARDTISDARWIAILWLSWVPLLVAVWPEVPPTVPPLGRSALQMTMIFLSIMTLFTIQLLRVQVVMSDSIAHRVGIDPDTGEVVSNPLLVDEALTIPRGTVYDRDGVALARTVFAAGARRPGRPHRRGRAARYQNWRGAGACFVTVVRRQRPCSGDGGRS